MRLRKLTFLPNTDQRCTAVPHNAGHNPSPPKHLAQVTSHNSSWTLLMYVYNINVLSEETLKKKPLVLGIFGIFDVKSSE